jgi:hypothetical protein
VTLGVKYELVTLIFGGACHHLISDAHAEREQQFLIASSLHTSVPYAYAQHILKGPFQILYFNFYAYAEQTRKKLMHICSWCAAVPGAYAQNVLNRLRSLHALVPGAYALCPHQFLTHMMSTHISS